MNLKLNYASKYELWGQLIRGGTDRIFVATEETPPSGARVALELTLPDLALPIVVEGFVVGRRPRSERFPAGVYLRLSEAELEKVRRYLGLVAVGEDARARRYPRYRWSFPVEFREPRLPDHTSSFDLSEEGISLSCPLECHAGQRVELTLRLPDQAPLQVAAEVVWRNDEGRTGLKFVALDKATRTALHEAVSRRAERGPADPPARRILVADDDEEILAFLSRALERHDYEVLRATTGKQALELIRTLRPQLVVLDVLVPGFDGIATCRAIRADAELADVPVIFISALDRQQLHDVANEAGANDYLQKPVGLSDLFNVVGMYLPEFRQRR
ncbi:MAG: response regulator [Deltaproteobacteria bacterium]|nr:MAG: response regulator [Deltaproteobacteria bacterium]